MLVVVCTGTSTCLGRVYWVGIRVGIPGSTTQPLRERGSQPSTAKRAPEGLQGLEWVVLGVRGPGGWTDPGTHPSGARSVLRPSLVPGSSECRLLANKGEISGHFY